MIALLDLVVNLPNHLGVMDCKLLNHWQLVGLTKQGLGTFDLSTGVFKPVDQKRMSEFVRTLETSIGNIYVTKCRTFTKEDYEEAVAEMFLIEHETFPGARDSFKAIKLTDSGSRLVKSLAEFQVDGDEIVKGLKALGVDVTVKIRKNFLGGWMMTSSDTFTDEENRQGISHVIEDYVIKSMKKGSETFKCDILVKDFNLYESNYVVD